MGLGYSLALESKGTLRTAPSMLAPYAPPTSCVGVPAARRGFQRLQEALQRARRSIAARLRKLWRPRAEPETLKAGLLARRGAVPHILAPTEPHLRAGKGLVKPTQKPTTKQEMHFRKFIVIIRGIRDVTTGIELVPECLGKQRRILGVGDLGVVIEVAILDEACKNALGMDTLAVKVMQEEEKKNQVQPATFMAHYDRLKSSYEAETQSVKLISAAAKPGQSFKNMLMENH
ncbi:hypothetical protein Esti_006543 [Eimeria stiedai]